MHLTTHEILQRYTRMRSEVDPVLQQRWGANHDDKGKMSVRLTEDVIRSFGSFAIGGIGFEGGNDFPKIGYEPDGTPTALSNDPEFDRTFVARIKKALPGVWKHLKKFNSISDETRLQLIQDDQIYGGRLLEGRLDGQPIVVSLHSLRVSPRVAGLWKAHGRWPASMLEIGGGHGRFIRDVATCSPDTKFFYCDLPENMALAASYLGRKFPDEVNLVWSAEDRVAPEKKINIIAPWHLTELPEGVEICCNFLSFQHMSFENLAYYAEILNARGVGSIYHENRTLKLRPGEIDNADYPIHKWYRIVSEKALGEVRYSEHQAPTGGGGVVGKIVQQYLQRRDG